MFPGNVLCGLPQGESRRSSLGPGNRARHFRLRRVTSQGAHRKPGNFPAQSFKARRPHRPRHEGGAGRLDPAHRRRGTSEVGPRPPPRRWCVRIGCRAPGARVGRASSRFSRQLLPRGGGGTCGRFEWRHGRARHPPSCRDKAPCTASFPSLRRSATPRRPRPGPYAKEAPPPSPGPPLPSARMRPGARLDPSPGPRRCPPRRPRQRTSTGDRGARPRRRFPTGSGFGALRRRVGRPEGGGSCAGPGGRAAGGGAACPGGAGLVPGTFGGRWRRMPTVGWYGSGQVRKLWG